MRKSQVLTGALSAALVLAGTLLAAVPATSALASKAPSTVPSITFFKSAIPIIGSSLSDSSLGPNVEVKDGWTITSPSGIANADTQYCDFQEDDCNIIWTFAGGAYGPDSVTGKYQWWQGFTGEANNLVTYATDESGNSSSSGVMVGGELWDSTSATYSAGWKVSKCQCFTDGSVRYSTTPGATATFNASGATMVSFVSEKASNRGTVALSINGGKATDVKLTGATANRAVVWNSGYLSGTSTLTVKVVSGRVDVDAFLIQ